MSKSIKEFVKPDGSKTALSIILLFPLIFVTDMDFSFIDFLVYLIEAYISSCSFIEIWGRIKNKKSAV